MISGGRISTGDFGGTTKRSSSSAVSVDPVREASIVRAQKKGRSNNLSTSDRLIVERDTISGVSEWPCSVCTLYNTVSERSLNRRQFLFFFHLCCILLCSRLPAGICDHIESSFLCM